MLGFLIIITSILITKLIWAKGLSPKAANSHLRFVLSEKQGGKEREREREREKKKTKRKKKKKNAIKKDLKCISL